MTSFDVGLQAHATPGWRPFTTTRVPVRRSLLNARRARVPNVQSSARTEGEPPKSPETAVLTAFLAFSAAVGLPYEADAKQIAAPPIVTEYDRLQQIVTGRAGETTSLMDSFRRGPLAAVGLPAAPKVEGKTQKEPASTPAGGVSLPDASAVLPDTGASTPPLAALGAAAAAIGLGGFAFLSNKGSAEGKRVANKAGSKAQVGTKRIGAAASKAAKKAPSPVKAAFGGAKRDAKKPAKAAQGLFSSGKKQAKKPAKAAGGLFGGAKQQAKKAQKVAQKAAPTATRKIQRPSTPRPGTKKIGTKQVGAAKSAVRKAAPSSLRSRVDDDTLTTLAAISVVGLGLLVSGFVILNVVTGVEISDVPQKAQEAVNKLPSVPNPLPSDPAGFRGMQTLPNAAPPVKDPNPPVIQPGPPKTPKGPELSPPDTPKPKSGIPLAPLPSEGGRPTAPSGPELLIKPGQTQPRVDVSLAAVSKAADAAPKLAKKADEATPGPPQIQRAQEGAAQKTPQIAEQIGNAADKAKEAAPTPSAPAVPNFFEKLTGKASETASEIPQAAAEQQESSANKAPAIAEKAKEILPTPPSTPEPSTVAEKAKDVVDSPPEPPAFADKIKELFQAPPSAPEPATVAEKAKEAVPTPSSAPEPSAIAEKAKEVVRTPPPTPEPVKQAQEAAPQVVGAAKDAVPEVANAAKSAAPEKVVEAVEKASPIQAQVAQSVKDRNLPEVLTPASAEPKSPEEVAGPPASAAFEEARKKLTSGKGFTSGADQFKAALEQPAEQKSINKGNSPSLFSSAAPGKVQPGAKAPSSGLNTNTLIFGGLVVAGGIAAAVAAPKSGEGSAAQASSSTGGSGTPSNNTGDVKDDIASRKSEAKAWIKDWRDRTGGK